MQGEGLGKEGGVRRRGLGRGSGGRGVRENVGRRTKTGERGGLDGGQGVRENGKGWVKDESRGKGQWRGRSWEYTDEFDCIEFPLAL